MNSLQHITFDTHSKVLEFFKDLNMPKELAVQFYAELEALLSAYISKLIFNAHTDLEMIKFRQYINKKKITDDIKIAIMLRISFEKKTGKKVDQLVSEILENLVDDLDKVSKVIDKHKNDIDIKNNVQTIFTEMLSEK